MILLAVVLALALPATAHAQARLDSLIPPNAPNCRVTTPPESAGIFVTPGGFGIVFPRNETLDATYTGCKSLWIADTDRTPRLATLYFERGQLVRAVAHDVRDDAGAVEGACSFPEGRSLVPDVGRRYPDSTCKGFAGEEMYGLRLATWPRSCMTKPEAPVCVADPR